MADMTWQEAEAAVARLYEGELQKGSGCSRNPARKQDVISATHLVEVKHTCATGHRVNKDLLLAIRQRAARLGLAPAFAVVFDHRQYAVVVHADVDAVLEEHKDDGRKTVTIYPGGMKPLWKTEYI